MEERKKILENQIEYIFMFHKNGTIDLFLQELRIQVIGLYKFNVIDKSEFDSFIEIIQIAEDKNFNETIINIDGMINDLEIN